MCSYGFKNTGRIQWSLIPKYWEKGRVCQLCDLFSSQEMKRYKILAFFFPYLVKMSFVRVEEEKQKGVF